MENNLSETAFFVPLEGALLGSPHVWWHMRTRTFPCMLVLAFLSGIPPKKDHGSALCPEQGRRCQSTVMGLLAGRRGLPQPSERGQVGSYETGLHERGPSFP